ncbi:MULTISPECIES: hypothetical protein [unclassified Flavobacterium]|uniref:hypothetical protein n=1 Tax=unclassified Flavobacterium TaxID=196869 RepID=UPI0012AA35EB|nr:MULTISPECIES: hypothetical protein [unclassified Flavobacterium]MBF4485034.1 hypothetical protein [Flavobacterium sp. CSZ]QGK75262.1 hypothetical protein GIY83_14610 [Flavobacterium sp. SLB02]
MFLKKIISVLGLLYCTLGYSQDAKEIFKKVGEHYAAAKPLQYKMNYVLFKDFDSKKVEESYSGVFYKNAQNEMYTKIGNTEILNTKKVNLKISHPEKMIEINKPIPDYKGGFDIKPLLEICKIEKCIDLKTHWEITLTTKSFTGIPYSKIVVSVSKTYFIQKQVFYYNTPSDFSKDYRKADVHYPRLEITNSSFNRNPVNVSLFKSETYFNSSGGKIVLSQQLKKYEIIDQRNVANNN